MVKALRMAFWDVLRGIDAYPEGTDDHIHFERAAQEGRVLVSNDLDMKLIAEAWCALWPEVCRARVVAALALRRDEPRRFRRGLRGTGRPRGAFLSVSDHPSAQTLTSSL